MSFSCQSRQAEASPSLWTPRSVSGVPTNRDPLGLRTGLLWYLSLIHI